MTERFFAGKFVIMHVASLIWPCSEKQASIFTSESSKCANLLEEVMMSLLNEFSARWPRQDKQSAAERKTAKVNRGISGASWKESHSGPQVQTLGRRIQDKLHHQFVAVQSSRPKVCC